MLNIDTHPASVSRAEGVTVLRAALDRSLPGNWPEPDLRYLRADLPEPPVLPLEDVFSQKWVRWIRASAEAKSAPADYVVSAVLAVFGSAAAVLAALVGLAGSVLALAKGSQWPGFSSRYARAADLEEDGLISPRQMWESLDRGLDPTRKPGDPD